MLPPDTSFTRELWLEIFNILENEYINIDAQDDDGARSIVSGLSSLSRTCRGFFQILQPVLYKTPVLVGTRSMEFFFRTIVEKEDHLASWVQTLKWYEGDEVDQLIEEENNTYWRESDHPEGTGCFDWGDDFSDKFNAKLELLGLDPYDQGIRGTLFDYMHIYPQFLPFWLPSLQTLDYRHNPRTHGFSSLSEYQYPSQKPLPGLKEVSARVGPGNDFNLGMYRDVFRLSRDTLEKLHIEWPYSVNEVGTWPPEPEFHQLKTLSVDQGCLGDRSFGELLFHSPSLEEFHYCSAEVHGDGLEVGQDDEPQLTWAVIHDALSSVKNTLRVLELDLHPRFYTGPLSSSQTLADFTELHTITLSQEIVIQDNTDVENLRLLVDLLPRTLKHFGLLRLGEESLQHIQSLAEAVENGEFPELETIRLDTSRLTQFDEKMDKLQNIEDMFAMEGVQIISDTML
jgi:hypothetical protein